MPGEWSGHSEPENPVPIETSPIDADRNPSEVRAHPAAIDQFLDAILRADMESFAAWAPGVHLDATVPGWRLEANGIAAVRAEYSRWFADLGRFEELRRMTTATGEVIDYTLTWTEHGVPHAAHHMHILEIDDGLIVSDTVMCGGRWSADRLAEIEAARNGGTS